MKNFLFPLMISCLVIVANGQGTFPPAHSGSNPTVGPGALTNIDLNGQYIFLGYGDEFYRMQKSAPYGVSMIATTPDFICTGDFNDNGVLYYLSEWESNSPLYSIDLSSGTNTFIANLHGTDIGSFGAACAMSFYNGKMYAIFSMDPWDLSAAAVFEINLNTGLCTRISSNTFPGFYTTLAIDKDGVFYGIDAGEYQDGSLYIIDPVAGTRTLIGSTGLDTWEYCDGDFDAQSNTLYISLWGDGTAIINTANATPSFFSSFQASFCAVGSNSTGAVVPINYLWIILAFSLIFGTVLIKRYFI